MLLSTSTSFWPSRTRLDRCTVTRVYLSWTGSPRDVRDAGPANSLSAFTSVHPWLEIDFARLPLPRSNTPVHEDPAAPACARLEISELGV
jgi:hypothetical protein